MSYVELNGSIGTSATKLCYFQHTNCGGIVTLRGLYVCLHSWTPYFHPSNKNFYHGCDKMLRRNGFAVNCGRQGTEYMCRTMNITGRAIALVTFTLLLVLPSVQFTGAQERPTHAIAMHGLPKLPADFQHFAYVNPDAPKGGKLRYGVFGTFDSLNPFIVKGAAVRGIWDFSAGYNVFESLLHRNRNEPFTLYGLLAEKVITDEERTFIEFYINPGARFADGKPVRAEDVLFSIRLLGEIGKPNYRNRWKKISNASKVGDNGVRFTFNEKADRELPLLIGLMPIFPKHATDREAFRKTGMTPMMGSGPYEISAVTPGSNITFTRRKDYWARDLPSKRGFDNFDSIQFEYFRDQNTLFDAFKKGLFDFYSESNPRNWETAFDFPAIRRGDIVKRQFKRQTPAVMQGFIFNTRRGKFSDPDIRRALGALFDFQWINKNLFANSYQRTQSFWHGSKLSSFDIPASAEELNLLKPWLDKIDPAIISGKYRLPISDGSGFDRQMLRHALGLFKQAGYRLENRKMVDGKGRPFEFELLINNSKTQERLALAWQQNIEKLGISMSVRIVDSTQMERRKTAFDFDVTHMAYYASFSPGAEQNGRWASAARDIEGSFNLAGAKDPAIDAMIEELIQARSAEEFHTAIRAYDRLLLNGHYMVPFYHLDKQWIALRKNIKTPSQIPLYGVQYVTWWDANAAVGE